MKETTTIYLTKKGMKELKKAISSLERDQQKIIRGLHDLDKIDGRDERLERVERLSQLETIESELNDKRIYLNNAHLMPRKRDAFKVAIGSVVDLIDTNGRMVRYTIVDSIEANPSDGRISIKSPLGQRLIGKQIKDMVEWTNGIRKTSFQLVGIA